MSRPCFIRRVKDWTTVDDDLPETVMSSWVVKTGRPSFLMKTIIFLGSFFFIVQFFQKIGRLQFDLIPRFRRGIGLFVLISQILDDGIPELSEPHSKNIVIRGFADGFADLSL